MNIIIDKRNMMPANYSRASEKKKKVCGGRKGWGGWKEVRGVRG